MRLEENIEIIDLPEKGEFKVVQIIVDGHPVMVCGPRHKFHKDILAEYLASKSIEAVVEEIPFEGYTKKLTAPRGQRYKVVGMGSAEINKSSRFFQLPYDRSVDYDIPVSKDFKEQLKKQFEGWQF